MRHDRHGRTQRADGDPRRRPADGFRVRDGRRFARLVEEAVTLLPAAVGAHAEQAELVIADVPAADAEHDVPLARYERAARGRPDRLTVFRRAVESRAASREELTEIARVAIAEEIADALGIDLGEEWDEPEG